MTGDMLNFLLLPHGVAALSRPFGRNPPTVPLGRRDLGPSPSPMWGEPVGKEQGRDRRVGPLLSPLPFREVPHQGRGTHESQPVYLQCCPLCTQSESQVRAGKDGSTTRGPYSTAELARAHSVIRPPAPTGTSQPPFKVGHRRGRPTPREETTISPPGAPRARSYPPRRPP